MTTQYAREGFKFFHVSTPTVFFEAELPLDDYAFTVEERKALARLEQLAETHGAPILSSPYRIGKP